MTGEGLEGRAVARFEQELVEAVGSYGSAEILPQLAPAPADGLDWFARGGPRLTNITSLVVPDLEPDLPSGWQKLFERGAGGIHSAMGCFYDVRDEHGPAVRREVPLDLLQWCQSRIAAVHRGGLADDADAMLALYAVSVVTFVVTCPLDYVTCPLHYVTRPLRYVRCTCLNVDPQVVLSEEMKQAVEAGRRLGLPERAFFQSVKGTTAYFSKLREDLAAHRRWLGPEAFLFTLTLNTDTLDSLAAWVVHQSRLNGTPADVWLASDERSKLDVLDGKSSPPIVQSGYWVHTEALDESSSSCPYHPGCSRTSLRSYAERCDLKVRNRKAEIVLLHQCAFAGMPTMTHPLGSSTPSVAHLTRRPALYSSISCQTRQLDSAVTPLLL